MSDKTPNEIRRGHRLPMSHSNPLPEGYAIVSNPLPGGAGLGGFHHIELNGKPVAKGLTFSSLEEAEQQARAHAAGEWEGVVEDD